MAFTREASSFRDDRGFVFWQNGRLYRQVNDSGKAAYDRLMEGGLYQKLVDRGLLVAHQEVAAPAGAGVHYKVIKPELAPFISYPYEWAFSQLKDAALATLDIQQTALGHGMTLRDASAYNIQFVEGRPRLIDTLSFDIYKSGEAWIAYRQFCQHFLAPLILMSKVDLGLSQLLRVHLDGIPLPLAAKLLPIKTKLNPGVAAHISLHAGFQRQHQDTAKKVERTVSLTSLRALIDSLQRTITPLKSPAAKTQWGDYYDNTNYSDVSFKHKERIVAELLKPLKAKRVLDMGSNDGTFSRIALEGGAWVLSADVDPVAVEHNYLKMKERKEKQLQPLLFDVTNPSPGLGWAGLERQSFDDRAKVEVVMALALIHHLAIANNLPLSLVADYFAGLAPHLIIEFVPKSDSQVKRLLATREDIFPNYTPEGLERAFGERFEMVSKQDVEGSERIMYHFSRKAQ